MPSSPDPDRRHDATAPANIFLDFLNRDSREIWGTFDDYTGREHRRLLVEALNVAVFLCQEYCVMPLGFAAEDPLVRSILQSRSLFLDERMIRLPMREYTLDDWMDKKRREYRSHSERYSGLFSSDGLDFLHRHPRALISRQSDVGRLIVDSWERGPDENAIWVPVKKIVPAKTIQRGLDIPRQLSLNGEAITWPAIRNALGPMPPPANRALRNVVQNSYFDIYLTEFALQVLSGLPIMRADFHLARYDPYYDYGVLRETLRVGNLWNILNRLSAKSVLEIRDTVGHAAFQKAHWLATRNVRQARDIIDVYARPLSSRSRAIEIALTEIGGRRPGLTGISLSFDELRLVEERFIDMAGRASAQASGRALRKGASHAVASPAERRLTNTGSEIMSLLVFVALREELELLKSRWDLRHAFSDAAWRGEIAGRPVEVLCAEGAGRVRAAVAVTKYLSSASEHPAMMIVTGMCGGFAETDGISPGDVIVASSVADLGTRKIHEGIDGSAPEFRIEPFRCDDTVLRVLASGSFDERSWANSVAASLDFPRERLPRLILGRMICADEVVSSDDWRRRLLKAWPRACGIDMESGGVLAAAEGTQTKVSVIRGVSDNANPLKADDEWRLRSVRAAAMLIERVLSIMYGD